MKKLLLLSMLVILLSSIVSAKNNPFYEVKKHHKVEVKKSYQPFAPKKKKHLYKFGKRIKIVINKII